MTPRTLARWRRSFTTPEGTVLTQRQAAEWFGVHERTWSAYEQGRYRGGKVPKGLISLTNATRAIVVDRLTFKSALPR